MAARCSTWQHVAARGSTWQHLAARSRLLWLYERLYPFPTQCIDFPAAYRHHAPLPGTHLDRDGCSSHGDPRGGRRVSVEQAEKKGPRFDCASLGHLDLLVSSSRLAPTNGLILQQQQCPGLVR